MPTEGPVDKCSCIIDISAFPGGHTPVLQEQKTGDAHGRGDPSQAEALVSGNTSRSSPDCRYPGYPCSTCEYPYYSVKIMPQSNLAIKATRHDDGSDLVSILEKARETAQARDRAEHLLLEQHNLVQQDLQLAAEFQQMVLPPAPALPYINTEVVYRPYAQVSGDMYDFLQNREGDVAIFLGDATGHGIAAALMTMMVHIGLEGIRRNMATDESLRILNRLIASRNTGRSVSAVFFRIRPSGYLTVTHAGHPPLMILPADGSDVVQFEQGGCALGIFEEEPVRYEEEAYQLRPGDKLVAYTDAAMEWANPDKEIFGSERLLEFLSSQRQLPVEKLATCLVERLEDFSAGEQCKDDLTVIVTEYCGE